jgi:hypothetical protein
LALFSRINERNPLSEVSSLSKNAIFSPAKNIKKPKVSGRKLELPELIEEKENLSEVDED